MTDVHKTIAQQQHATFRRRVESWNKWLWYWFFRLIFRNRRIDLPLQPGRKCKVLVLRYDRMGDMVVSLPLMRYLAYGCGYEVDVLCSPSNYSVLDDTGYIRSRYILNRGVLSHISCIYTLRRQQYDLILPLVFQNTTYNGLLANAINGRAVKVCRRVRGREKQYSVLFNTQIDLQLETEPMLQMLMRLGQMLCPLQSEDQSGESALSIADNRYTRARSFLQSNTITLFVVVNVSAGGRERDFDVGLAKLIIEGIHMRLPEYAVVVMGTSQHTTAVHKVCDGNRRWAVPACEFEHLLDAAALIRYSSMVISPDTSITHVADSLGVALVCAHLKENSNWYPSRVPYRVVISPNNKNFQELKASTVLTAFDDLAREIGLLASP